MISTKNSTEITQKAGMYLKVRERKMSAHLLACLPDTKKKILCEFTEKCFADFNQSSRVIYLTWYSFAPVFLGIEFISFLYFMA